MYAMDVIKEASPSSEGSCSGDSDTTSSTSTLAASGRQSLPKGRSSAHLSDLFPRTRRRVGAAASTRSYVSHQFLSTPANFSRQLLSAEFRWDQDIEALIRDELDHHYHSSPCAVFLSKWLHIDQSVNIKHMVQRPYSASRLEWMSFALDLLDQRASPNRVTDSFVRRLLSNHELHAAVTVLLGLGNRERAVEIYASHGCFMEAILLTCLVFPGNWLRQQDLVARWDAEKLGTPEHRLAQPQRRSESLGQFRNPCDSYHDSTIGVLSMPERHDPRPSDVSHSAAHRSEQHSGHQTGPRLVSSEKPPNVRVMDLSSQVSAPVTTPPNQGPLLTTFGMRLQRIGRLMKRNPPVNDC